jgi:hypothetical protein
VHRALSKRSRKRAGAPLCLWKKGEDACNAVTLRIKAPE